MAGLATGPLSYGWLSPMARAQYAALASMRWGMFRNAIRSTKGALELGARTVTVIVFSCMGLGLAFGIGFGSFELAVNQQWAFLPILFWSVFFLWQIVPITLASFQQQFDMAGLLRFPVSFSTFYMLHLVFGFIDASTIVGCFCCLGMCIGLTVARPDLFLWNLVALAGFAAFNIFLVRAIFAWIDRWLAQRRTREIVTAVFFVLILGLQLLNPGLRQGAKFQSPNSPAAQAVRQQREKTLGPWIGRINTAQKFLPPGLAAQVVLEGEERSNLKALEALAGLGLFGACAAGALGVRLRGEYHGENFGDAPSRTKPDQRRRGDWLLDGSGPMAAVFEKELRTIMRAIPLLYQLASPLVVVFVLTSVNRNHSSSTSHLPLGLMLCLAYAVVGFTQVIYNNLGAEGAGIQILFLSPTPIRTVMLAKNLFHAALFAVDAVLVGIVACWRLGTPPADAIAASVAWVLFALPLHLAAGNGFSIMLAYKVNLGRMGRQKGSQANALLSLAVQAATLGIGALVFALCAWSGRLWLAAPVFLVLAAIAIFAWMRVLGMVDRWANARREDLIETLVKAE